MASDHAPQDWNHTVDWLAAPLHGRLRGRLPALLWGVLFAGGRRVVAAWIRAAGLSHEFQNCYFLLQSVGRRWREVGMRLLVLVLVKVLKDHERVLLAIDDSPTKRSGPQVQGAGVHHDPTPGTTGNAFCYGHVWVTLAVVVRHRLWGAIGLPICSWLYVRAQDVPKLPKRHRWTFQNKLQRGPTSCSGRPKRCRSTGKRCGARRTAPTPSGPSSSRS